MSKDYGFLDLMCRCTVIKQQPKATLGFKLRVKRSFIVYKKIERPRSCAIASLIIPRGAIIVVGDEFRHGGKLRVNRAEVTGITSLKGDRDYPYGYSSYDSNFVYKLKQKVKPKHPFSEHYATCASGIHFFMNRVDAVNYC